MWNRIYLLVLAVCFAIMAALTYYSWSWLGSIGAPQAAADGYLYHSGHAWTFLWISSAALLILANVVLAKFRRSWAMWTTFVYFGIFIVVRYVVLEQSFFQFKKANGLWEGGFSLAPVAAVIFCAAAAALIYSNQFAVVRLSQKLHPTVHEPEVEVEDVENGANAEPESTD